MNGTIRIIVSLSLILGGWMLAPATSDSASAQDGLLRQSGRHIQLTTDLQSIEEVTRLVAAFDAAVPLWEQFWKLPSGSLDDWKLDAYVMRDPKAFRRRGMIPPRIPDFRYGYASGKTVWAVAQPSEYYTRHLLLHEGVHVLMFDQYGGAGPAWFMEGTAEMLSTHRGLTGDLLVNDVPKLREDVPYWGRFKKIRLRRETGSVPSFWGVIDFPKNLQGDVESYAWSWAATMMLYEYDDYRDEFFAAAKNGYDISDQFNQVLRSRLSSQWPIVSARWRLMCLNLDFGFDWQRERVDLARSDPLWDRAPLQMTVDADRGWQSAGVRFPPGSKVTVSASGQCTLAVTSRPWTSEPAGITIQYHGGRPLGQLVACVVPNSPTKRSTEPVLKTVPIRDSATLTMDQHAWLMFRINDEIGKLGDNTGQYEVVIQR